MRHSTIGLGEEQGPAPRRRFDVWLFRARWIMAPFYAGLVFALLGLLAMFAKEMWIEATHLRTMTPAHLVVVMLSLIDMTLLGNLLLIVILSGYETFVSRIKVDESAERPGWMGSIDFSGMKLKLMSSLVAISAVILMRGFMQLAEGDTVRHETLAWLVGIHVTFVLSALLLALMDFVMAKAGDH